MMNHTNTTCFKKLAVAAVAVFITASAQASVVPLTANSGGSTAQYSGFSVAGTLTDGFSYDEKNPTATSPNLTVDSGNAAHGANGTNGVSAVLAYTAAYTVLEATPIIVLDVWGRDVAQNRDNNFSVQLDVSLAAGGTTTVTATGGNIPDTSTPYQRLTFSGISAGDTINAMRIIGVDADGSAGGNYFTIMEARLAAIREPSPITLSVQPSMTYTNNGTQKVLTLPFSNSGALNPLMISSVTLSGNDAGYFTVGSFTSPVAVGANGTVNFTFNPTDGNRDYYVTLKIASNDSDSPLKLVNVKLDFPRKVVTLPGTGVMRSNNTFEGYAIGDKSFNYNASWAGSGYGLSGTQRGAPEYISIQATPGSPNGGGAKSLCFYGGSRNPAWYALEPEAVGQTYYGNPDKETQDDFFLYSSYWKAQDRPSVMMHIYMEPNTGVEYRFSSIRMPLKYEGGVSSWPGIWLRQDRNTFYVKYRRPGYSDAYNHNFTNVPTTQGQWFTLGLSVTEDGDIHYFGVDKYVTSLTMDQHLTSAFTINDQRGEARHPITERSDAVLMTSNSANINSKTYFDSIQYTTGAYDSTSFGAWQIKTFGSVTASGAGASDDPDNDGRDNFYEYAFGTDPNNSKDNKNAVTFDGSKLSFNRRLTDSVEYILEESTDLASNSWTPVTSAVMNVISLAGDYEKVEMTKTNDEWLTGNRTFFRVRCVEK